MKNRYHDGNDHEADKEVSYKGLDDDRDQKLKNITFENSVKKSRQAVVGTNRTLTRISFILKFIRKARDEDQYSFQYVEAGLEKI